MASDDTEQAAFVAQITLHQSMLRSYIISLMPGMDGVDDVLQQANLVLWEKRANFQPGTNFQAWACAIARFEVKSHRRKMLRKGTVMLDPELAEMLAGHCEATPGEVEDRLFALNRCLGRLGEKERELIDHRYYSKLPLEEFAVRCGRPTESLRVSLFRIRSALKNCINGELTIKRVGL